MFRSISRKKAQGISLRKFNYVLAVLTVALTIAFLLSVHQIADKYENLRTTVHLFDELDSSSRELMAASDYLTEQVRLFTVTGDRKYLDNYFEEALITRRREMALDALRKSEVSEAAYQSLERAMNESVALMQTEYLAMNLRVRSKGYDLSDFPPQVREVNVPSEYLWMTAEGQENISRALVLSENYCQRKDSIASNMEQCVSNLMQVMNERQAAAENEMSMLILQLRCMVLVVIFFVILRTVFSSRLIVGPLLKFVSYIRSGQPLPVRGSSELKFLARTYNQMFLENNAYTERLAFEANHDNLTGAYNRGGYEMLLSSLDMDTAALLLVDVDKFKSINDTYGHKAGDLALKAVSKALADSFRSDDYICRIGGDEFAVIMKNTGPERKEQIESKIRQINDRLKNPHGDAPPVTLSVGCAFGSSENGSGAIGKDADVALYRVKENGRCGCAFYE